MKKFIMLTGLILFAGMSLAVMAEDIELELEEAPQKAVLPLMTAPKWEEFCEPGYEYVTAPAKDNVLSVVNVVKSEREKKTYWAERRAAFDKYLANCKTIVDDYSRGACYTQLRRIENDKNDVYNSKRKELLYQHTNFVK